MLMKSLWKSRKSFLLIPPRGNSLHVRVFSHLYVDFVCSTVHFFVKASPLSASLSISISVAYCCSHITWQFVGFKPCCIVSVTSCKLWHDSLWGAICGGLILLTVHCLATNCSFSWWQPESVCKSAIPFFFRPRGKRHQNLYLPLADTLYILSLNYFPLPLWWRSKGKW